MDHRPMSLLGQSIPNSAFAFELALTSTSDISLHRTERRFGPLADIEGLGMRRSTLLELSGMELYEVAHVHRCFAGELAHGVRHAVVTPLLG